MPIDLRDKTRVTLASWRAQGKPPGVWIDLLTNTREKLLGMSPPPEYDKENWVWWFIANDGSKVAALQRPRPPSVLLSGN